VLLKVVGEGSSGVEQLTTKNVAFFPIIILYHPLSQLYPVQMFKDDIFIGLLPLISPWESGAVAELDCECIIQFVLINIL
jgi:hypothetical protein